MINTSMKKDQFSNPIRILIWIYQNQIVKWNSIHYQQFTKGQARRAFQDHKLVLRLSLMNNYRKRSFSSNFQEFWLIENIFFSIQYLKLVQDIFNIIDLYFFMNVLHPYAKMNLIFIMLIAYFLVSQTMFSVAYIFWKKSPNMSLIWYLSVALSHLLYFIYSY